MLRGQIGLKTCQQHNKHPAQVCNEINIKSRRLGFRIRYRYKFRSRLRFCWYYFSRWVTPEGKSDYVRDAIYIFFWSAYTDCNILSAETVRFGQCRQPRQNSVQLPSTKHSSSLPLPTFHFWVPANASVSSTRTIVEYGMQSPTAVAPGNPRRTQDVGHRTQDILGRNGGFALAGTWTEPAPAAAATAAADASVAP